MKVGDIIYVRKSYTARYGKEGGSYEYHFVPGDMYEITYIHGLNCVGAQNKNGDGIQHYVGDIKDRFWTKEEYLPIQREEILEEMGI
jgi:hypothetical protein